MKIEIREGGDWAKIMVDGVERHGGHSIPRHVLYGLLKELGAEVERPRGDFCAGCGGWLPERTTCEPCAEYDREQASSDA